MGHPSSRRAARALCGLLALWAVTATSPQKAVRRRAQARRAAPGRRGAALGQLDQRGGGEVTRRTPSKNLLDATLRVIFTGLYPKGQAPALATSPTVMSMKFLLAGAVAGIISRTLVSPLEVVATLNMATTGKVLSVKDELRALWAAEGISGFYKGNGANCLKVAPTKGIQFVAFEFFKRIILSLKRWQLDQAGDTKTRPTLEPIDRLIAGGFAGMLAAACAYPLETVKSLLTVERGTYRGGIFASMAQLVREQGFGALYRGLVPTLIAMFPYVGVEFCSYETLRALHEIAFKSRRVGTFETLAIGAVSGLAAQSSCHPLDVVRKRLQLQGIGKREYLYTGMLGGLYGIAKAEGVAGLYKGLRPACFATIPSTGSSYIVYEAAKTAFGVGSS